MKIYTNCRQEFVDAIVKVFKNDDRFLNFIGNEDYSHNYDCFVSSIYKCYIINRASSEYISWYMSPHLGKDIRSNISPDKFVEFLTKFKRSAVGICVEN